MKNVAVMDVTEAQFYQLTRWENKPGCVFLGGCLVYEKPINEISFVILMNVDRCTDDLTYANILAHELGHLYNNLAGIPDSEQGANKYARYLLKHWGLTSEVIDTLHNDENMIDTINGEW